MELILRSRWASVERRVQLYPRELELEKDGLTCLHWLCCNLPPVSTLRIVLEQDRQFFGPQKAVASRKDTSQEGNTALLLLFSIHEGPIPVSYIQAFCEYAPECLTVTDYFRRTPLHLLCGRGVEHQPPSNAQIARLLLQTAPQLATMTNNEGQTALDRLWTSCGSVDGDANQSILGYFWHIVRLVLQAAPNQKSKSGSLLHQLVAYPLCRGVLLDYAIDWHPEHIVKVDDDGNTPLHILLLLSRDVSNRSHDMRDPTELAFVLIRRCPFMVHQRNKDGELPLHLSFSLPWSKIHEALIQELASALEASSLPETFYPSLLAQTKQPRTIYSILQTKPNLMMNI